MRVAFQGEPGAFSEAAAVQLLGENVVAVPRPTFEATFRAIADGAADALLVPVENSLAGSVVRVYDLLLQSELTITAENTAGSVREALARGDKAHAAIAGKYAADRYRGAILAERIQDNAENFTRFVLLRPAKVAASATAPDARKMSIAMRLAHRPGSLLSSLEPFARNGVNLLKIESRPIHGRPWEYQFFVDVEADVVTRLETALSELRVAAHEVRVLGLYPAAQNRP